MWKVFFSWCFFLFVVASTTVSAQSILGNRSTNNGFQLTNLLIPEREIRQGGPPRDGIPSIDSPKFISPDQVDFMKDSDYVLGVVHKGIAKAYPISILNYHEIVNDRFDNENIVITYCPLCGSGMAFLGNIQGQNKTFGVSGLLYNSDVLLYDRQTQSLWSQIMGKAVSGVESGKELTFIPTFYTTLKHWKTLHTETLVLSTQTGHQRDYTTTPYQGYEKTDLLMFPVNNSSNKLAKKARVLGVEVDGKYKAYPLKQLRRTKQAIIEDSFNGQDLQIHFDKASESARVVKADGTEIPGVTLFWFAWYAFHPETEIYIRK